MKGPILAFFLILALAATLAGCGPKLTPVLADHAQRQAPATGTTNIAQKGETLFKGLEMFTYDVYSPRETIAPLLPNGVDMKPLAPDQKWIAYYVLDDGTLIVEAPRFTAPGDMRLGLRVDADGRVVGNRPWFDLGKKSRPHQPSWDGARRYLFQPAGKYLIDLAEVDVRFMGAAEGEGVFEFRVRLNSFKGAEYEERFFRPGESLEVSGARILFMEIEPEFVRYAVEPIR